MLCKCSGKYIDIYFILKITYIYNKKKNINITRIISVLPSENICFSIGITFIICIMLRPHPGHTGNYTPVPGRRVGRTQMEESRRLVERYLNTYAAFWRNIKE